MFFPPTLPTTPAMWSTPEIEAISEVIGLRCAGGSGEFIAHDEPDMDLIEMDYHSSNALDQTISVDLDETRAFDIRDLVSSDINVGAGGQVRARDVIPFVVLARHRRGTQPSTMNRATPWTVPDTREFHSLITRLECYMISKQLPCIKAKKWANLWGKVGLIGLSPRNPTYILSLIHI